MPRQGTGPALSERWIGEVVALRAGGPTTRYPVRTRVRRVQVRRTSSDPLFGAEVVLTMLRLGPLMYLIDKVFGRWTQPPMEETHAELGLYDPDVRTGDLPRAVVDFPVRLAAVVAAQGGTVAVRGEVGPGHGIVLVLDDGEVVPCQYPAGFPVPVGARSRWGWREPG